MESLTVKNLSKHSNMRLIVLVAAILSGICLFGQTTDSIATPYGEFTLETTDSILPSTGFIDESSATSDGGTSDFVEITSGARMAPPVSQVAGLIISLTPNPASENVQLNISGIESPVEIKVLDLTGRIIYSRSLVVQINQTILLPASQWSEGTYTVTVICGTTVLTEHLVVSGGTEE